MSEFQKAYLKFKGSVILQPGWIRIAGFQVEAMGSASENCMHKRGYRRN